MPCTLNVYDMDDRRHYLVMRACNDDVYQSAKKDLEVTFGPSVWQKGRKEAGRYLEFRPVEYQKSR